MIGERIPPITVLLPSSVSRGKKTPEIIHALTESVTLKIIDWSVNENPKEVHACP